MTIFAFTKPVSASCMVVYTMLQVYMTYYSRKVELKSNFADFHDQFRAYVWFDLCWFLIKDEDQY